MTQHTGSGPDKSTEHPNPEEAPGSARRDHTVPPANLDPVEEHNLPEGGQPPKRVAKRSWFAAGLSISLIWIAAALTVLSLLRPFSLAIWILMLLVVLGIAAMPILVSWRLRLKELERLNQ